MSRTNAFLILIVYIFKENAVAEPINIKEEFTDAIVGYLKEVLPTRQSYINEVKHGDHQADGGIKYFHYLHNLGLVEEKFNAKIDQIVENLESKNSNYSKVDKALINFFKEASKQSKIFVATIEQLKTSDYKEFILMLLGGFTTKSPMPEDFGDAILRHFNNDQLLFEQFISNFQEADRLKDDEKIQRFEDIMADIQVMQNKLDQDFIEFVEKSKKKL